MTIARLGIFVIIALSLLANGAGTGDNGGKISFERTEVDMGDLKRDPDPVVCEFRFKNTGKSKLAITGVKTSCSCTVAQYTRDAVSPGDSGVVRVTFNGRGFFPQKLQKVVTVYSTAEPREVKLYIKGRIKDYHE